MGRHISFRRRCYRIITSTSTDKLHLYRIPRNTLPSSIRNTSSYIAKGNPNNRARSSPGTIPSLLTLHNITTPNKNTINITDYYVSGKGLVLKFPVRHSPSTPPSLGSVKKLEKDGKDDTEAETPSNIVTGRGWKILKTEEERQAEKTAAWEKKSDKWKYRQGRMWEKRRAAWLKKRAAWEEKRDGIMGSDEEE